MVEWLSGVVLLAFVVFCVGFLIIHKISHISCVSWHGGLLALTDNVKF